MPKSDTEDFSLDEALLATLTPQEREALADTDDSPQRLEDLAKIAAGAPPLEDDGEEGEGGEEDGEEDDDPDDDDAAEPAGAAKAAPADEKSAEMGAASAQADQGEAPQERPVQQPAAATIEPGAQPVARQYRADLPADYDDKLAQLKERDKSVREKYKAGEIDIDERDAQLDAMRAEREELLVQRARVETLRDLNAQDAQRTWAQEVGHFVAKQRALPAERGGIDYAADQAALAALDEEVKALASMARHADKSARWFLEAAHKRVLLDRGVTPEPAKPAAGAPAKPEVKAEAKPATKPPAKRDAAAAVRAASEATLANVPGGAGGPVDVAGEQYADIMALDGMDFEMAIARMTPDQRERFIAGL